METIVCGVLERKGTAYFLVKEDKLELPHVIASTKADPVGQIAEAFKKQTGIKVSVEGIVLQTGFRNNKHIEGKKAYIVFKLASPDDIYEGHAEHVWLSFDEAKRKKLDESSLWIKELRD